MQTSPRGPAALTLLPAAPAATQYDAGDPRSVAQRVQRQLLDIQYARTPHPWSVAVD